VEKIDFKEATIDIRRWRALGPGWREKLNAERRRLRSLFNPYEYEREDLGWYKTAFFQYFAFIYDTGLYDPVRNRYTIEELLDRGEQDFGGFDLINLWHGYPRLGVDERSQFDLLRDLPGGLTGLRDLVDRAHARGVRVFIPYTPWDKGTRRESATDFEELANMVAKLDLDGLCLDTMKAADPELRKTVDRAKVGVVFSPEYVPPTMELAEICTGSDLAINKRLNRTPTQWWDSHWQKESDLPMLVLIAKWLEPRYSVRGNLGHYPIYQYQSPIIANDFFHGMGHQIVENLFGWWTPYSAEARTTLLRASRLLRAHSDAFLDPDWQPYVDTLEEGLFAHRWKAGAKTVYTLFNNRRYTVDGPAIAVTLEKGEAVFNGWDGGEAEVLEKKGPNATLAMRVDPFSAGCLIVQPRAWPKPDTAGQIEPAPDMAFYRLQGPSAHLPRTVTSSRLAQRDSPPAGMVLISEGRFVMKVRMELAGMEGGCYSYPDRHGHPDRLLDMPSYFMDRTEVTNRQYREFLLSSHYRPRILKNFLSLWRRPSGTENEPWRWDVPEKKEDHPVVHVDLDDARAFARGAGKRLPTEEEWQYAAQGGDGRRWPWGNRYDPDCCNGDDGSRKEQQAPRDAPASGFGDTEPVEAHPLGASSFGCLDLSGNVWEWTESERNDGHTRYAIIRGGSYFIARGSKWYTSSGAQPCDRHQKMLLLYPGLDRCTTVGFRCVKDIGPYQEPQ
jgi:formylglycine-generating enzyme required for sulfatase activity